MWKSLSVPQALGDGVVEGQARHRLVGELGVEADHLGPLERVDEGQGVADGGQEHVAAGFVGLRFEGEAQVVAVFAHVGAAQVDGLGVAVEGGADTSLAASASTPSRPPHIT